MAGASLENFIANRVRHLHLHKPIVNVNELEQQRLGFGARTADAFANAMGSWRFIIIQSVILTIWVVLNVIAWISHWDPYPFILLNLALSFQAAYAAPIIMMSQNRQAEKDRLMAEHDYEINTKAEDELKSVMHHLEAQDDVMLAILHRLEGQDDMMLNILRRLESQHGEMIARMDGVVEKEPA
ncbi:MAG TPA: DUF1003 domain-containing protein [Candidatus Binataceae bacterium]|nr:DUF1003 domain-containing protein [Candidatus Binataceae bacterium]